MPLKLTKIDAGLYQGQAGDTPRFDIRTTTPGASVDIVGVHYRGTNDNAPPWEITLAPGDEGVVFLVFASTQKARLVIEEVDPADPTNRQDLSVSFFDKENPFDVFTIRVKS